MRPPECSLVNDRPVKIVGTADGGADCLVLDWASGSFVPDRSYFSRTLPGDFKDVDAVTPQQMDRIVAGHRCAIALRFAETLSSDMTEGTDVLTLLGLRAGTPPFDADHMEPTVEPGLMVIVPRLLVRRGLDAVFGVPVVGLGPDGTRAAVYRLERGRGACTVLAMFPSDGPEAEAVLVQFVRADA
jgi:hypothetical protein